MRQFLEGHEAAWEQLERRAKGRCVRFRNEQMPLGCRPDRAHVGFEIDNDTGTAQLLVTKGIRYSGDDSAVCEWFDAGKKEFPTFTAMRHWIQGSLGRAFNERLAAGDAAAGETPEMGTPQELTDITAVHDGIREIHRPLYLDEDMLFERIRSRILGQDDAVRALAAAMVRHLARRRPARPAVVFAIGPSGVGKTRTVEVMANALREFDDETCGYQFLRLDMTEYQESHRVSQLIGSPQGYVGHNDGSQLLDALRANPHTIVLFDEIEKAHAAVLRVLMNAMDAGRLSTASRSSGSHEVDCRHAVFVFTSNQDAKSILDELETRDAFGNRAVEDDVCRRRLHAAGVAPEIVGRIGSFLVYRPLSPETRAEIVALAIAEVAGEYGLHVAYVEPSVIVYLMHKSRSESFGVRPERFLIDDVLGGAFAATARRDTQGSVTVAGPPFECQPHISNTTGQE